MADARLSEEALAELRDWLMNGAPTCGNQTYVAGVVGTRDVEKLFNHIAALTRELEEARMGEFLFSKRKALVERCAELAEQSAGLQSLGLPDDNERACKFAAHYIREHGLSRTDASGEKS